MDAMLLYDAPNDQPIRPTTLEANAGSKNRFIAR